MTRASLLPRRRAMPCRISLAPKDLSLEERPHFYEPLGEQLTSPHLALGALRCDAAVSSPAQEAVLPVEGLALSGQREAYRFSTAQAAAAAEGPPGALAGMVQAEAHQALEAAAAVDGALDRQLEIGRRRREERERSPIRSSKHLTPRLAFACKTT